MLKERLDEIAKKVRHDEGFNKMLIKYRARTIVELCKGPKILELGCGDGLITLELLKNFNEVVAVDGSKIRVERAQKRVSLFKNKVKFFISLFEDFNPTYLFDTILMSGILEHVEDPISILKKYKKFINEDSYIVIVVPNAESIHRRIGKIMGIISDLHELTGQDIAVNHKRYYDLKMLRKDIIKSGLKIESFGGIFFKPLSNKQMEMFDSKIIDAFYELGKQLPPEYCAEIWVRCTLPIKKQ